MIPNMDNNLKIMFNSVKNIIDDLKSHENWPNIREYTEQKIKRQMQNDNSSRIDAIVMCIALAETDSDIVEYLSCMTEQEIETLDQLGQ